MHRPAKIRIDYRLSFWPFFIVFSLLLAGISGLFLLLLDLPVRILLSACLVLLALGQCLRLIRQQASVVVLDDNGWSILLGEDAELPVQLLPKSFSSRFLVVLDFREMSGARRYCLWFARDNCSEADFRALCRALRS